MHVEIVDTYISVLIHYILICINKDQIKTIYIMEFTIISLKSVGLCLICVSAAIFLNSLTHE